MRFIAEAMFFRIFPRREGVPVPRPFVSGPCSLAGCLVVELFTFWGFGFFLCSSEEVLS
jgi:hypothetical protein